MSKKIMCLFLALLFVISSLAGCAGKGSSNEGAKDTANGEPSEINFDEEPYTVNFLYLVGMEGTDQQKVNDAVNELTLKELNMKVNMIPMTFGTYMSQLPLMLSSGEALDIFPAMANQFATYIEPGRGDLIAFLPALVAGFSTLVVGAGADLAAGAATTGRITFLGAGAFSISTA